MSAMVVQVIWTNSEKRGAGVEGDVVRRVTQLWTLEGVLICEYDVGPAGVPVEAVVHVNPGPLEALGR